MNEPRKILAALALLASPFLARTEPAPDPLDFMANLTAFTEHCGSRYPEFSDTPQLLVANMTADDRALYDATRQRPEYPAALAKARAAIQGAPADGQREACKMMHDGLQKH